MENSLKLTLDGFAAFAAFLASTPSLDDKRKNAVLMIADANVTLLQKHQLLPPNVAGANVEHVRGNEDMRLE